jgi:hypothetical protein
VERAKVEEFRTTNVALMRERDELNRRFERSDSEAVRAVAAAEAALHGHVPAAANIDAVRVGTAAQQFQNRHAKVKDPVCLREHCAS